jgi:hypothetical protein
MEEREVIRKVNLALDLFYEKDAYLLEINVHERSIAHKFSEYLQLLFPDYNVDCEYDKHGKYTKTLEGISECRREDATDRILPDIVIHERGNDKNNLIVFEIKSKSDPTPCDIKKLELLTKQTDDFRYYYGIFIKFNNQKDECGIMLFVDGKIKR